MKNSASQSLTKMADAAFRQAAKKVIERAEQTGTPVVVWAKDAVKELQPATMQTARKPRKTPPKV